MSHLELVEAFYTALRDGDVGTFLVIQTDDVVYNISGHSPISGCFKGKHRLVNDLLPMIFPKLDMTRFGFSKRWKVVCSNEASVVCLMEADGFASNGERYDQRYVHIFEFSAGKIAKVAEFFDTELAQKALFSDVKQPLVPDDAFQL